MKAFIHDDFLLTTKSAQRLYHDYAENMPIFDYHCHLNPQEIYENQQFANIGQAWLGGDHYKWRLMRANAVPERYITGSADFHEKFDHFAKIMPGLIGNPIYHWSHLELKRFFGIDTLLSETSADEIWNIANEKLQSPEGCARALIQQSNVKALCTTDDPIDDLKYHQLLAKDSQFTTRVLPTFRPDKILHIQNDGYAEYVKKLGAKTDISIQSLEDIQSALTKRLKFFAECGCRLSDHSFGAPDFTIWDESAAQEAMTKALSGESLLDYEVSAYQSWIMQCLSKLYTDYHFTMQLHMGVLRNLNTKRFQALGADVGCDSIGDPIPAASLAALLDRMAMHDTLPRTILYTLNAVDNDKLVTAAGCFQDDTTAGKIQFGSAWWFNDHYDGMTAQLKSLASMGVLSRFVGMLTDSRSFLSYPRHEYFRRILCEVMGNWMETGFIPNDYDTVGKIVSDICYHNVCNYLGNV